MVIIGVSAGVSYGQFQRLTAQVATAPVAEPVQTKQSASNSAFVAASTTTWTAAEPSGVVVPLVSAPAGATQPEPPLQRFAAAPSDAATRVAPTLSEEVASFTAPEFDSAAPALAAPLAAISALPAKAAAPKAAKPATATASLAPVQREFKTATRKTVAPGTLRRFRNEVDGQQETSRSQPSNGDGSFEQVFPPRRAALKPKRRAPRASVAASTRIVQRQARFQQIWSTGVYR